MLCMEHYWERVARLRESLGLSKQELAEAAGVTASYIYRIESGQVDTPSYATVRRLAAALHITPAELMGDDGLPAPTPANPYANLFASLAPNTPQQRVRRFVRLLDKMSPHQQDVIAELMAAMDKTPDSANEEEEG